MIFFIPSRIIRLIFFTLAAGGGGLISAEATALTLCLLVLLAACCRSPIRLELILMGIVAFAARYSQGDLAIFKATIITILPLFVMMGGLYLMGRAVFRPRSRRHCACHSRSDW